MESLIIRKIPSQTKEALRRRAALRGHSMEEEARIILREAVSA
ncbi:MAG: FitA-like ribbon-helix-helix domain-containing protein, partial [Burkholderiaceae bacterium]